MEITTMQKNKTLRDRFLCLNEEIFFILISFGVRGLEHYPATKKNRTAPYPGNPAICSSPEEIRGFPSPPHGGFGFFTGAPLQHSL
jgi:hypothetical protein